MKPKKELRLVPERDWRADYVFEKERIVIELHGGVFSGGRHTTGVGFTEDRHKMNMLQLNGWCVLEYTTADIENTPALVVEQIKAMLHHRRALLEVLQPKGLWSAAPYSIDCVPLTNNQRVGRKPKQKKEPKPGKAKKKRGSKTAG